MTGAAWLGAARTGRAGRLVLAALAGLGTSFAQPPAGLWPLLFLAVPALLLLVRELPARAAAATGWVAGAVHFGAGLHWVSEAFLVDAERHGWMAPFAVLFLGAGLALFWAAAFWLAARLRAPGAARSALLLALWTLAEYARSHVLTGFPWALPGHVWVDTPVAQAGSLFGPHMLGFLTLAAAGAAAVPSGRGARVAGLALGVALVALGWAWGGARLGAARPVRADAPVVRLVQPNSPQDERWNDARAEQFFRRLLDLTAAPAAVRPAVVIWPETAVPWLMEREEAARAAVARAAGGAPVILGSRRLETPEGRRVWRNAVLVLGSAGEVLARYDKHHLVPFGEYVPGAGLFDTLGLTGLVGASFTAGPGPALLDVPGLPRLRPLICYEAVFPHEVAAAGRPGWLVQVTNDAWFGSSAGPWQHLAQARMRAIEQGLPLARAAVTGVSAMIDPWGRILVRQDLLTHGYVDSPLPDPLPPTLYSRTGDLPWVLAIALGSVMLLTIGRRNRSTG